MAKSIYLTLAESFEPKIRKALIAAWNQLRTQESRAAIERALTTGGIEAVLSLFDDMDIKLTAALSDVVDDTLKAGAGATIIAIPTAAILNPDYVIDMFNPYTANFIRQYKLDLISTITNNTREAMRASLTTDLMEGVNPIATARNFRNNLGLTPYQERAVRNYRRYLESLDPTALNRILRDKRFDRTIRNAIASGKSLTADQVDKMTNRYRERYIKYRSEVIARTESLRAISIGNDLSIRQMIDAGDIDYLRVKKFWKFTHDNRTRHAHRQIPRLNAEGRYLDESFVTPLGPLKYPRDPQGSAENTVLCRCTVNYKIINPEEV